MKGSTCALATSLKPVNSKSATKKPLIFSIGTTSGWVLPIRFGYPTWPEPFCPRFQPCRFDGAKLLKISNTAKSFPHLVGASSRGRGLIAALPPRPSAPPDVFFRHRRRAKVSNKIIHLPFFRPPPIPPRKPPQNTPKNNPKNLSHSALQAYLHLTYYKSASRPHPLLLLSYSSPTLLLIFPYKSKCN